MSAPYDVENAPTFQSWTALILAGVLSVSPNRPALSIDLSAHPELHNSSTTAVGPWAWTQDTWKAELRARYETMAQTAWFREAHEDKSLGDPVLVA